jgi:5-hydroxyisourate hydrolase
MITTHILDISRGKPSEGVTVRLERKEGAAWKELSRGVTNADGRVADLLAKAPRGVYRLIFETKGFFPEISIAFEVSDERHHHVPLLLSPFGYSTYRGS